MSDYREYEVSGPGYSRAMPLSTPPPYLSRMDSPLGRLELGSDDGRTLSSLSIEAAGRLPWDAEPENDAPVLERAREQLREYFAGSRREFDLPVDTHGSPFREAVWRELTAVPFGTVLSYGELGRLTGRDGAARAVGGAVGSNPVPIIVPCHRVLASNGKITGYSGGNGIPTKAWLLDHEGIAHR